MFQLFNCLQLFIHSTNFPRAVKYVNPITKICIFRTSREAYQKVWAAITMVRNIGNCPVVFNLLDLSGKSYFIAYYIYEQLHG